MFTENDYGKPLNEGMRKLIKDYTTKEDRAYVATSTLISMSTLRDVTYGNSSLTERNAYGIKELLKRANENAACEAAKAKEAQKELKMILAQ